MNEVRLEPRSIKEAHLYVELHPCPSCGHAERAAKGALSFEGDHAVKRHNWPCGKCGTPRSFTFVYPAGDDYLNVQGYGDGSETSRILDAGEFLAVSDHYAKQCPATPGSEKERKRCIYMMQEAIFAMEEVLKFVGPDPSDMPPPHALTSADSQRFVSQRKSQFKRMFLEARLGTYRDILAKMQNPAGAPASSPAPQPAQAPAPAPSSNTGQLEPRSIKEAHLYVELHPCPSCGTAERADRGALSFEGDRAVKRHNWPCGKCGTPRSFTFVYPAGDAHLQVQEGYGNGSEPSRILDAGQFLAVSDRYAKSCPASPKSEDERKRAINMMQEAIFAMEEVLKFIGPGATDQPPPHALTSADSKRLLAELPGQMQRGRLEARLGAYRGLLEKMKNPQAASAPQPAAPAPGGPVRTRQAFVAEDDELESSGRDKAFIVIGLILLVLFVLSPETIPFVFYPFGPGDFAPIAPFVFGSFQGLLLTGLGAGLFLSGLFGVLREKLRKASLKPIVGALVGAILLGPPVYLLAEWQFDNRMFEMFVEFGDADSMFYYLDSPHTLYHEDEVKNDRLPVALLMQADNASRSYGQENALKDLKRFAKMYPDSNRHEEIVEAEPRYALKYIEDNEGGIPEYRAFIKTYPDAAQAEEAREIIHARYVDAFNTFEKQAADTHPALIPFVQKLLDHLEGNENAHLEMVFHPPSTETLQGITQAIQDNLADELAKELGRKVPAKLVKKFSVAPIEPFFSRKSVGSRESSIASGFKTALNTVFPTEVLNLVHLQKAPPTDPSQSESPSLVVRYSVKPSEARFSGKADPYRIFIGIIVDFEIVFHIPGDPETLTLTFSVAPPEKFSVSYDADTGGPSDSAVYNTMVSNAFANLQAELRDSFFRPDSEASKRFDAAFGDEALAPRKTSRAAVKTTATPQPQPVAKATPPPTEPPAEEAPTTAPEPPPTPPTPPTPPSTGEKSLYMGAPVVKGSCDAAVVKKAVEKRKFGLRNCYKKGLKAQPDLSGGVVYSFKIDDDGAVSKAKVKASTLGSSEVEACIVGKLAKITFKNHGGACTIEYPFAYQ